MPETAYIVYVPKTHNRCIFTNRLYALSLAQDCAITGFDSYVFTQKEGEDVAYSLYYYSAENPNWMYNVPNKYVMDDRAVWYTGILKKGGVN